MKLQELFLAHRMYSNPSSNKISFPSDLKDWPSFLAYLGLVLFAIFYSLICIPPNGVYTSATLKPSWMVSSYPNVDGGNFVQIIPIKVNTNIKWKRVNKKQCQNNKLCVLILTSFYLSQIPFKYLFQQTFSASLGFHTHDTISCHNGITRLSIVKTLVTLP